MAYGDYLKRIAVMIFIAMPVTALAFALVELRHEAGRSDGVWNVVAGAFGLVYVWGILTAIPLSLLHTVAMRGLGFSSLAMAALLGMVLGLLAGAVTPTFFTGFFNLAAIVWGGFTGVVYAVIVSRIFSSGGSPGA